MSELIRSILKVVGAISAAFLLALLALTGMAQLSAGVDLIQICHIEETIFQGILANTRQSFTHLYYLHTVLLYGFAILGTSVFLFWSYRYVIAPVLSKMLLTARVQILWRRYPLFIALASVCLLLLSAAEVRLRYLSFCPGSKYMGNDFSQPHPSISYILLADERGMNYFNKDSFHNKTDTTQLHVNAQGFPGWFDFTREVVDSLCSLSPQHKRKMLVLGDSFAEGVGASIAAKSFIELYRHLDPGKLVCNTGIGGMDPIQYRLVAEKYIPILAPDEVVVLFCGWNDLIMADRPALPYLPVLTHMKNVGVVFNVTAYGEARTPTAAYEHYRHKFSLMERRGLLARICRQTCFGTKFYYAFCPTADDPPVRPIDSFVVYRNLKRIQEISDSAGARFTILFIPTPDMADMDSLAYTDGYSWAFKDLWPHVRLCPKGMIRHSDCSTSLDYHFNDSGQRKFAEYMQCTLMKH